MQQKAQKRGLMRYIIILTVVIGITVHVLAYPAILTTSLLVLVFTQTPITLFGPVTTFCTLLNEVLF